MCRKFSNNSETDPLLVLSMNKGISFPEYDALSKIFKDDNTTFESDINFLDVSSIEIVYYEEAHFLLNMSKSKYISIFRKETFVDNDGNELKGVSGADESYKYQASYNWGIQIKDFEKLLEVLKKEKEEPTVYDLTPEKAVIQEPIYRKAYRLPRRRKR